jgi:hypothetical protein
MQIILQKKVNTLFLLVLSEPLRSPDYDFEDEVSLCQEMERMLIDMYFIFNGKFQVYQRTYIWKIKIHPKYLSIIFQHFGE